MKENKKVPPALGVFTHIGLKPTVPGSRARRFFSFLSYKCILCEVSLYCIFAFASPITSASPLQGTASWYSTKEACGPKTNNYPGCPTASGKSMYELEKKEVPFAAIWNYPFGTRLRVTNRQTGKSMEVLVLDRGPNKRLRGRVIDLSKKSFEAIGESGRGLIPVRVEALS